MHSQNLKVLYQNPVWSRDSCKTEVYTVIFIKEMLCLLLYFYLTNSSGVVSGTLFVNKIILTQKCNNKKTNQTKSKNTKKLATLPINKQKTFLAQIRCKGLTHQNLFCYVSRYVLPDFNQCVCCRKPNVILNIQRNH